MIGSKALVAVLMGFVFFAPFRGFFGLDKLTFITEVYPPYDENDILEGIVVDPLVAVTAKSERPLRRKDIRLLPWPRGYSMLEARLDAPVNGRYTKTPFEI